MVLLLAPADWFGASSPIPSTDPARVSKIEAKLRTQSRSIDRFEVDASDYEKVLALFRQGTIEKEPARWMSLADIWITYTDGRTCGIWVFDAHELGAYKIGETYYRGATTELFERTIIECHDNVERK